MSGKPIDKMVKVALRNLPQYISKSGLVGPDKHSAMLCFEALRDALTAAQQQGQAVAWPTEAKHAGSGDWEARTSICAHTMSEAQARVWNACLAACKAANTAPPPSAPALAQQPAAVDAAMVERACVAHFNGMYQGGNGSGTAFTWEAAPESMKAKPRQAMRAALTAALATQHQEPKS